MFVQCREENGNQKKIGNSASYGGPSSEDAVCCGYRYIVVAEEPWSVVFHIWLGLLVALALFRRVGVGVAEVVCGVEKRKAL